MENTYLAEAFKSLNSLLEAQVDLDDFGATDEIDEIRNDGADEAEEIEVADLDAESEDELEDSYIGKVILDCNICHGKLFREPDDVVIDDDTGTANNEQECPYCFSVEGYSILGQVAPYEQTDYDVEVEPKDTDEMPDDKVNIDEEANDIPIDECVKRKHSKSLRESSLEKVKRNLYKLRGGRRDEDEEVNEAYSLRESSLEKVKRNLYKLRGGRRDEDEEVNEAYSLRESSLMDAIEQGLSKHNSESIRNESMSRGHSKSLRESSLEKVKRNLYKLRGGRRNEDEVVNEAYDCSSFTDYLSEVNEYAKTMREVFDWDTEQINDAAHLMEVACNRGCNISAVDALEAVTNQEVPTDDYGEKDYDAFLDSTDLHCDRITENTDGERGCFGHKCKQKSHDRFSYGGNHMNEGIDKLDIETDTEKLKITAEDKVDSDAEMIAPLTPANKAEIEQNKPEGEEDEIDEGNEEDIDVTTSEDNEGNNGEVDVDIDDFDENQFDDLGESYLRRVYENVNSYKTKKVSTKGNKMVVEGLITFNSGKSKPTKFIFESKDIDGRNTLRFVGKNSQISHKDNIFTIAGKVKNNKFITESFKYNYNGVRGTVSNKKK